MKRLLCAVILAAGCTGGSPNSNNDAGGTDGGNGGGSCTPSNCSNGCCSGTQCLANCPGGGTCQAGYCQGGQPSDGGNDGGNGGDGGSGEFAGYCSRTSPTPCSSGLSCLSFGGNGGFCTEQCDGGPGDCPGAGQCANLGLSACVLPCPAGTCPFSDDVCEPTTAGSFCVPDCRAHPDICPAMGSACDPNRGFCVAVGSQMYAQPCGQTAGACASTSLQCIVLANGAMNGFCSQQCTLDGGTPCPNSPAGAQCVLTLGSATYCGFPCTGPDAGNTCPTGLSCQLAGGNQYFCW